MAKNYYFPLVFIAFMGLLQLSNVQQLRYSDQLIQNHEYWRLLTAHWVHLNALHWALNSVGFIMLIALLRLHWSVIQWLLFICLLSVGISICFIEFNPQLQWYVGFSGVLYGLYALAALLRIKADTLMALSILVLVIAKIVLEQFFGGQVTSQSLLNAPVVVDAHAYGLMIGLILGAIAFIINYIGLRNSTHSERL